MTINKRFKQNMCLTIDRAISRGERDEPKATCQ